MSPRFSALSPTVMGATRLILLASLVTGLTGPAANAAPPSVPPPPTAASVQVSGPPGQHSIHSGSKYTSAEGGLVVQLDPSTVQAVPIAGGAMCRLRVPVVLGLTGTVEGTASGTTVAFVGAPCADATSTPPGTFADTFRFTGDFRGTVSGVPTTAEVEYVGITRAGREVAASLTLRGSTTVLAAVRARAGAEGTYRGVTLARVPGVS